MHFDKTPNTTLSREDIGRIYASEIELLRGIPVPFLLDKEHLKFADAILNKNAFDLEFLSNGISSPAKKAFSKVTGIELPKQQKGTWDILCQWAGVNEHQKNVHNALLLISKAMESLLPLATKQDVEDEVQRAIKLHLSGYTFFCIKNRKTVLTNRQGEIGLNLTIEKKLSLKRLYEHVFNALNIGVKTEEIINFMAGGKQ